MAPRHVTEFVRQLTPMAVEIGDRYGIDPALIITQAAIESGWGQEVSGNNYFGVKSHGQPGGQTILTHEEINGQKVPVYDNFRVYDSLAGSMEDYAKFLSTNPRYGDVFKTRDLSNQVEAIANSGYATDSNYPGLLRDVSRMVSREMGPMPPAQIPNVVASQLDTTPQTRNVPLPLPRPAARKTDEEIVRPYLTADMQVKGDNLPSLLPAQITPGLGSLTPDFFKSPAPPSRLPDIGSTSSPIGPGPTSLASVQDMYGRPQAPRIDPIGAGPTSIASVQDMYGRPSGVGKPPATRSVPSVAMAAPPVVPGPSAAPKGQERLEAGIYPMAPNPIPGALPAVATALDVVPDLPRFPPLPQRRPIRASMPTPMGQRPMPVMPRRASFSMPTPMAQRPAPLPTMRVTVNGAGSYSGGSSGGGQPAQRFELNGKEVRPQVVSIFNPDAPNGGAFEKRTVYR